MSCFLAQAIMSSMHARALGAAGARVGGGGGGCGGGGPARGRPGRAARQTPPPGPLANGHVLLLSTLGPARPRRSPRDPPVDRLGRPPKTSTRGGAEKLDDRGAAPGAGRRRAARLVRPARRGYDP